ncbi:MAG: hypothetical protein AAFS11_09975, partial [Planctomycetota bacterium]
MTRKLLSALVSCGVASSITTAQPTGIPIERQLYPFGASIGGLYAPLHIDELRTRNDLGASLLRGDVEAVTVESFSADQNGLSAEPSDVLRVTFDECGNFESISNMSVFDGVREELGSLVVQTAYEQGCRRDSVIWRDDDTEYELTLGLDDQGRVVSGASEFAEWRIDERDDRIECRFDLTELDESALYAFEPESGRISRGTFGEELPVDWIGDERLEITGDELRIEIELDDRRNPTRIELTPGVYNDEFLMLCTYDYDDRGNWIVLEWSARTREVDEP